MAYTWTEQATQPINPTGDNSIKCGRLIATGSWSDARCTVYCSARRLRIKYHLHRHTMTRSTSHCFLTWLLANTALEHVHNTAARLVIGLWTYDHITQALTFILSTKCACSWCTWYEMTSAHHIWQTLWHHCCQNYSYWFLFRWYTTVHTTSHPYQVRQMQFLFRCIWNSLSATLKDISDSRRFRQSLKMHK